MGLDPVQPGGATVAAGGNYERVEIEADASRPAAEDGGTAERLEVDRRGYGPAGT
jgi:hypothetical protein